MTGQRTETAFRRARRASLVLSCLAFVNLAGGLANAARAQAFAAIADRHAVVATADDGEADVVVTSGRNPHRLPRSAQRHVGTAEPRGHGARPAAPERP